MSILRDCPIRLAAALASHTKMFLANLYQITLIDGTIYRWTDWERTLVADTQTWTAMKLKRGKWNLTNTMTVPSMDFTVLSAGEAFEGGANIKAQAHNGLFDGAEIVHSRAYMIAPDDTTALGVIALNAWIAGEINVDGGTVAMTLKGRNNRLNQQAPRNLYQASCLHTFCDAGCGLARANFTTTHAVGTGATPTRTFIPWDTAPSDYALYKTGTVEFLNGAASGQSATITAVDATGLTLAYPLYGTPAAGDSFTAFKGCLRTKAACADHNNSAKWEAFPYTPTAETGV